MIAVAISLVAGLGVFYLYTALALKWHGVRIAPKAVAANKPRRQRRTLAAWMNQAGLVTVAPTEFVAVVLALAFVGGAFGFAVFGTPLPAIGCGLFAATFPVQSYRRRRLNNLATAQDNWPRLIEEIRLLTTSLGRSIPQALFEVGRRVPDDLRVAFVAAEREWLISTDFERTVAVLKDRLADPTADATLETLLVAHEIGGTALEGRLLALAEDRQQDVQGRKDARSRQAGARFARRFVLVVPSGMALVGLRLGEGRNAYQTPIGQALVVFGLVCIAACWAWAGHFMKLPSQQRVFG
ncbi:MAG: type II secretion system F family protein [Acidimicrobiia bacterium]